MFLLIPLGLSSILQLNDTTFDSSLHNVSVTFLLACQPTVSYCVEFYPKFEEVSHIIGPSIQFAILPLEGSELTRERFRIVSDPSLFLFRGTRLTTEYTQKRTVPEMVSYLERITGPLIQTLKTATDSRDYISHHTLCVILSTESLDNELHTTYKTVANVLRDLLPFAIASTRDAIEQLNVEELPALQLYRGEDRQVLDFPLAFGGTAEVIKDWILENRIPRYFQKDGVIFRNLIFDPRCTLLGFVDMGNKKSLDLLHETFQKVISEYGENLTYVYADIYEMGTAVLHFGFSGVYDPVYMIGNIGGVMISDCYLFPEARKPTPKRIVRWIGEFLKRETSIDKVLKMDEWGLKMALGDPNLNIVAVVLGGTAQNRSAMLSAVAATADYFEKKGEKLLKFCQIDANLIEIPGIQIDEFGGPTVVLWPAGAEKKPIIFPGNIQSQELINTIDKFVGREKNGKPGMDL
jgi:hypothetical protein